MSLSKLVRSDHGGSSFINGVKAHEEEAPHNVSHLTMILPSHGTMVPPLTTRRLNLLASSCLRHISVWPEQNGNQHPTRAHLGIALPYFVKPSVQRASEFQKVLTHQDLKLTSPKFQWLS